MNFLSSGCVAHSYPLWRIDGRLFPLLIVGHGLRISTPARIRLVQPSHNNAGAFHLVQHRRGNCSDLGGTIDDRRTHSAQKLLPITNALPKRVPLRVLSALLHYGSRVYSAVAGRTLLDTRRVDHCLPQSRRHCGRDAFCRRCAGRPNQCGAHCHHSAHLVSVVICRVDRHEVYEPTVWPQDGLPIRFDNQHQCLLVGGLCSAVGLIVLRTGHDCRAFRRGQLHHNDQQSVHYGQYDRQGCGPEWFHLCGGDVRRQVDYRCGGVCDRECVSSTRVIYVQDLFDFRSFVYGGLGNASNAASVPTTINMCWRTDVASPPVWDCSHSARCNATTGDDRHELLPSDRKHCVSLQKMQVLIIKCK